MLPGKNYDRKRAGQALAARVINALLDRVARLERLGASAPITLVQTPGGPVVGWAGPLVDVQFFLPKNGPIPAATGTPPGAVTLGRGKATLYYRDPNTDQLRSRGQDHDVFNWAPAPAGDTNRWLLCARVNGAWTVVAEACPPSQGG